MVGESQLPWTTEGVFLLLGVPGLMFQHSKIISGVIDDHVLANNDYSYLEFSEKNINPLWLKLNPFSAETGCPFNYCENLDHS